MAKQYVCTICGYVGRPSVSKGGRILEVILWLALGLPGLVYTVWRATRTYRPCPKCNEASMISTNSTVGRKLMGL